MENLSEYREYLKIYLIIWRTSQITVTTDYGEPLKLERVPQIMENLSD